MKTKPAEIDCKIAEILARYPEWARTFKSGHKLSFEGTGPSLMGRCSCGDAYLPGLGRGTLRQQVKTKHEEHLLATARADAQDPRQRGEEPWGDISPPWNWKPPAVKKTAVQLNRDIAEALAKPTVRLSHEDGTRNNLGKLLATVARSEPSGFVASSTARAGLASDIAALVRAGYITFGLHPQGGHRANITRLGRDALANI